MSLCRSLPLLDALSHGPNSHDHTITAIIEAQGLIAGRTFLTDDEAAEISIRLGTVHSGGRAEPILDIEDILRLAAANAKALVYALVEDKQALRSATNEGRHADALDICRREAAVAA